MRGGLRGSSRYGTRCAPSEAIGYAWRALRVKCGTRRAPSEAVGYAWRALRAKCGTRHALSEAVGYAWRALQAVAFMAVLGGFGSMTAAQALEIQGHRGAIKLCYQTLRSNLHAL